MGVMVFLWALELICPIMYMLAWCWWTMLASETLMTNQHDVLDHSPTFSPLLLLIRMDVT
jgi:hypothetical protein